MSLPEGEKGRHLQYRANHLAAAQRCQPELGMVTP